MCDRYRTSRASAVLTGIPLLALGLVCACQGDPSREEVLPLRLVDLFPQATVEGGGEDPPPLDRTEWSFADVAAGETAGWTGAAGVAGLSVQGGRLSGRVETEAALLHAPLPEGLGEDLLHSVEIKVRVEEGGQLAVRFSRDEEVNLRQIAGDPFPWPLVTPLVPEEDQVYVLTPSSPVSTAGLRHMVLRPTDQAGARFEIESIRLVSRREHLRGFSSGVGWHGMSNAYRETLVARSPTSIQYRLTLPPDPWLDLAVATIEPGALTFAVEVTPEGESSPRRTRRTRRTVTTPDRWEPFAVAMTGLGGRTVSVSLSVVGQESGSLGFWGSPVVRSRVPSGGGTTTPQGVIVIVADTLRSDHFQANGYGRETAPNLTRLAQAGTLAQDCVSQATWTKVSMPSIFTSLYPSSHTVADFTDRLPASAHTLAEVFRHGGFATLGLVSIQFAGQFTNLHQGYEELHESGSLDRSSAAKTAREYVDRLLPWLERHRDVPFYVFLHVSDPHSPYTPYAPYDTVWGEPGDQEEYRRQQNQVRPLIQNPLMRRFGMPRREEIEKAGLDPERYVAYETDGYDGSIRSMDVELGRLLERLDELGLTEKTLIAFVSDHGTELLEHDDHFHGHSAYGELSRVPLFFHGPGVPPGVVLPQTVQTIDLMPTVLDLAGLSVPDGVQGQSLRPLFAAGPDGGEVRWRQRPAVTEKALLEARGLPGRNFATTAFLADGWRLIHNESPPDGVAEYELYDHRNDPLNLHDLAAEHPDKVEALAAQLEDWRKFVAEHRLKSDAEAAQDLSAEELERLRSLGYL